MFQRRNLPHLRRYADEELGRVMPELPGWHAEYRPATNLFQPKDHRHDFWVISQQISSGFYMLEIDSSAREFLFWFGHGQAGATPVIDWVVRPAAHISLDALTIPSEDAAPCRFRLGDIVLSLIKERGAEWPRDLRFPKNWVNLT
jgi:hypothetical protein